MFFTLPISKVDRVTIPMPSSSGNGEYAVLLNGHTASCPCRGFRYHQAACRHSRGCLVYLEAIIPPGEFPS